jgi:hypothetical protein
MARLTDLPPAHGEDPYCSWIGGLVACQKGLSVGFVTAATLVHELIEARDEKRLLRLQRQLAGYKLLIIDELGYVPLSTTGAELLFEVFSQRYERGSTIVTSNLPFDEWTGVFGSDLALVIPLTRTPEPVGKQVMGLQLAGHSRPLPRPIAQDAGHRQLRIVVADRLSPVSRIRSRSTIY